MKKIVPVLVVTLIVITILAGGGYYLWFKTQTVHPDKVINENYSFLVRVDNIKQLLNALDQPVVRDGMLLNHQTLQFYNLYNKARSQFNKLGIFGNVLLNQPFQLVILKDHPASPLLVFDTGIKTVLLSQSLKTLPMIVKDEQNLRTTKTVYQNTDIHEIIIPNKQTKWYIATVKNLVLVSLAQEVITKSLDNLSGNTGSIYNDLDYLQIKSKLSGRNIARTYFSSSLILGGINTDSKGYQVLSTLLDVNKNIGLAVNEKSNILTVSSFNSIASKEKLFSSSPQELKMKEIVPSTAELFFCVAIDNFKVLWDYILKFSSQDTDSNKQLELARDMFKKVTGQTVEDSLLSWVGNELGVVYMPTFSGPKQVLILRLADKKEAMDSFAKIEKNLAAQVFLGLSKSNYGKYQITYISQPFLFKLLLGAFIGKKVEMYYTFIENYLVFGDDAESIKLILDNKEANNTLDTESKFQTIAGEWFNRGNMFCYWNISRKTTLLPQASIYVKSIMNLYSVGGLSVRFADGGVETRLVLSSRKRYNR